MIRSTRPRARAGMSSSIAELIAEYSPPIPAPVKNLIARNHHALHENAVRIVDTFPPGSHAPITYPAAAMRGAREAARGYLDYLGGPAARDTWHRFGFRELEK